MHVFLFQVDAVGLQREGSDVALDACLMDEMGGIYPHTTEFKTVYHYLTFQ